MRYHPDNRDTGDELRFSVIMEAHGTPKDPVKRAQYDILHKDHWVTNRKLAEEASDLKGSERDLVIQGRLLSILYVNVDETWKIRASAMSSLNGC